MIDTRRNVRRLLVGRSISFLGSGIYLICLPLYILKLTDSLSMAGLYFAIVSLPALVFTIPLGAWCERINHKALLIGCDVVSGIIFSIMGILSMVNCLQVSILMMFGMILSLIDTVFGIISNVLFTELNDEESLESMNGLKSIFDNIINLSAPMIGTFLYSYIGIQAVLWINAISFLLSAFQETFIQYIPIIHKIEKTNTSKQIKDGFHYVIHAKNVLPLFTLVMVLNFFVSPSEEIYYPGILKQLHGIPDSWYGLSSAAFVFGTLVAGIIIYRSYNSHWQKRLYPLFVIASVLMGVMGLYSYFMMGMNQLIFYSGFLILCIGNGLTTSLVNIPLISSFQRDVDMLYQARFFAMLNFASRLLIPLGMTYAGFLCDLIRPDIAYLVQNLIVIGTVLIIIYLRKKTKRVH